MELPKTYDPKAVEDKWYNYWLDHKFFHSEPDEREPYTIVIPPPNVTGVLHMGHMLNNTIQDMLIRKARMQGKNACWVPGTDHASIATEAKVVAMLKEKGIDKKSISRDEFMTYAWEWKEKYGGIILKQLEKLGCSCDWDRTRFTMEDDLSEAVIDVFIDLHKKGQIYRGVRMVNWDPQGLTAISDEEVIHKEVNSKLYYVRYKIVNEDGSVFTPSPSGRDVEGSWVTIATTRPETILGDTAVCVHPNDERYKHLAGKKAIIPMVNRAVPIIFDTYIDLEFGTGALKVTPAHDINDYNLGIKHGLEVIDTLNPNGTISAAAGFYIGEDRFAVRKKIVEDLKEMGHIVKVDEIKNKVGTSERTGAVIEPRLSMQWFLKMDKVSKPALENVMNGNIKLIPDKFINTYKHWMENVHDWCISRQLWWGQRIPAWYDEKGNLVAVCKTKEEAMAVTPLSMGEGQGVRTLVQDEDVLDTWFSSWLWPISVFDGFKNPNGKDINYYYPTNDLVTAPEILFFWVARMIIAGYEYRNERPFTNVYLTGIVRDKLGRKMSKSLGNSPDPLDLIAKHGADGVRAGMLYSSPAGNDLLFDEGLCEQGRNFTNKIWNAFRLVKGWEVTEGINPANQIAIDWFDAKCNKVMAQLEDHYSKYRMSDALMTIYKLIWDDFCSWYLEMIKPEYADGKSQPIDRATYDATLVFFERLMKLLHPIMPFITEEIYKLLQDRTEADSICVSEYPKYSQTEIDELKTKKYIIPKVGEVTYNDAYEDFEYIKNNIIPFIKTIKMKELKVKSYEKINVVALPQFQHDISMRVWKYCIEKLTSCVLEIHPLNGLEQESFPLLNGKMDVFIAKPDGVTTEYLSKLISELKYTEGFLLSVQSKLNNEKFINNANQQVIDNEKKKLHDAQTKINALQSEIEKHKG